MAIVGAAVVGPGVDTGTDVAGREVPEVPEGAGDSPPPPSDVHAVVTDVAMAAVASNAAAVPDKRIPDRPAHLSVAVAAWLSRRR
jgi:hypothetical protein